MEYKRRIITDKEGKMMFQEYVTCGNCKYGREFGGNDFACRCEERQAANLKLVNKSNFSCEYAEGREQENDNR